MKKDIEKVGNIVRDEIKRNNYKYEEIKSKSSESLYFKLYYRDVSLLFRVSDHSSKKDILTLRTDHNLTSKSVVNFVNNRYNDLKYRKLKQLLGTEDKCKDPMCHNLKQILKK